MPCECGQNISVPSMLHLKKQPQEDANEQIVETNDTFTFSSARKRLRNFLFLAGLLVFVSGAFFLFVLSTTMPQPKDVLSKIQIRYNYSGGTTFRNPNPISELDQRFFYFQSKPNSYYLQQGSYEINDIVFDYMTPIDTFDYWESLKDGPALSANYYEHFQNIKNIHFAKLIGSAIWTVFGLIIFVSGFFIPLKVKVVSERRGADWR